MPKIPHSPIRMYFLLQPPGSNGNNQAESECKACGLRMKGNHASNMERHVRRSHPEIYEQYLEVKQKAVTGGATANFVGAQAFEGLNLEFDPANFLKIKKIRQAAFEKQHSSAVTLTPTLPVVNTQQVQQNVLEACVELVTTNGRPFSLINDSGLQTLINLTLPRRTSPRICVDEKLVKELVAEKASKLKHSILERLSDNVVNVKVDITTSCNRSFMGISVSHYDGGQTFSHMISFNEINVRYESDELESMIWKELQQFGIAQKRVYCIVIDSGSNLSTLVNDLVIDETESSMEINDIDTIPAVAITDSIENVDCTASFKVKDSFSITEDSETNVRVITVFSENEDEENDLDWCTTEIIVGKLDFGASSLEGDVSVTMGMKCVADVLQIAVSDTLKSCEEINDVLKEARSLYQKLLALSEKKIINITLPSSISLMRWKSTFTMLEKIIAIKSGCIKLGIIGEDEQFWNQVEDLLAALRPCKMTSDILQKEKLTIGDVYKVWFNCILETSKIGSSFAKALTECMRQKQVELFNDSTFLAALLLDPRFNNMILTDAQKTIAINHLVACHRKFASDRDAHNANQQTDAADEMDELEKIFQLRESSKKDENARSDKGGKLEVILKNFCESEPRLKTTESVIAFWEKKKAQYPDIYDLARIIFSVPATQQTFFRVVSQVQYVMNTDIALISESLFNDVILIRSNSE